MLNNQMVYEIMINYDHFPLIVTLDKDFAMEVITVRNCNNQLMLDVVQLVILGSNHLPYGEVLQMHSTSIHNGPPSGVARGPSPA